MISIRGTNEIDKCLKSNEYVNGDIIFSCSALYRPSEGKKLSATIGGSPGVMKAEYSVIKDAFVAIDSFVQQL